MTGNEGIIRVGALSFPAEAMSFAMSRSSGPGGQNVNKLNTRVEVRLPLAAISGLSDVVGQRLRMLAGKRLTAAGELRMVCQQTRSQEANRQTATQMLLSLLDEATRVPRKRRATRPTRSSQRRRIEAKKRRGSVKHERRAPAGE